MPSGAKPAVQGRSKETRAKIMAALDALLRTKPFSQITVTDLSAEAGVSAASIYQRFSNQDALIAVLIELYLRRIEEWSRSEIAAVDLQAARSLDQAVRILAQTAWVQIEQLGYIMRPAYLQSRLRPDLIGQQWSAHELTARKGFSGLLKSYPDDLHGRNLTEAADTIAYFFNMMMLGKLLHETDNSVWKIPRSKAAFGNMLSDFVCGYLARGRPSKSSPRRPGGRS